MAESLIEGFIFSSERQKETGKVTESDREPVMCHSRVASLLKEGCSAGHETVKTSVVRSIPLDPWKMTQPHSLLIRFNDAVLIASCIYVLVRRKTTSQGLPAGALKAGLLEEPLSLPHSGGLGL